jgi:lysophospholipase L1-like esterase
MVNVVRFAALLLFLVGVSPATEPFYLSSGDRVVFFGDSITDQRMYNTYVEAYVLTRFPNLNVTFVHSGWSGDRVSGGGGGPIDQRLDRDVIAHRPTVVSINLGMNDGEYRSFDQTIFEKFTAGYEHIVEHLKQRLPGVRITVIQPSPYDDFTRPPVFEPGYNAVLQRYCQFLREFCRRRELLTADLNTPVAAVLRQANQANPIKAREIIPDRVHPSEAGHLLMAAALLKSWNAPSVVTDVEIDAASTKVVSSRNSTISELAAGRGLSWTQLDAALPFPIQWDDESGIVPVAIRNSDFLQTVDFERLAVANLKPGRYLLAIDGLVVGIFTGPELAEGLNLAAYITPMMKQARETLYLTLKRAGIANFRWRFLQISLADDGLSERAAAIHEMDRLEKNIASKQRASAQPRPHHYTLLPTQAP